MSRTVTHADSPFDATQEARIRTLAQLVAEGIIEELASRGGLPAVAGEVLTAMQARDYGFRQIDRFPHEEPIDAR